MIAPEVLTSKYNDLVEFVSGDTETAKKLFTRWRIQNDLFFLGNDVLGMGDSVDQDTGKRRIDPVFHSWMADKMQVDEGHSLILLPRDHLKTTWARTLVIQKVLEDANRANILLLSRTAGLSIKSLTWIANRIQHPNLVDLFPEEIPISGRRYRNWEKRDKNAMTMRRFPEEGLPPADHQIEAWGMDSSITGTHFKTIVLDDIIDEQNCTTVDQINKVEERLGYLMEILDPDGQILALGTRYHFNDIYERMMEMFPNITIRRNIEHDLPIYSYYTKGWYAQRKRDLRVLHGGDYIFSCQYELNPIPRDEQIFPPPQLCYEQIPRDVVYQITVDPAYTTQKYSDTTAICVGGVVGDKIYVCYASDFKETLDLIAVRLIELAIEYPPQDSIIWMESGFHENFIYIWKTKLMEYNTEHHTHHYWDIGPIGVSRRVSKTDRVQSTAGAFMRAQRLLIHQDLTDLQKQMEKFPRDIHDDLVDAMAMQVVVAKDLLGNYGYDAPEKTSIMNTIEQIRAEKKATRGGRYANIVGGR